MPIRGYKMLAYRKKRYADVFSTSHVYSVYVLCVKGKSIVCIEFELFFSIEEILLAEIFCVKVLLL